MWRIRKLGQRLRALFFRRAVEDELAREMAFHLEQQTAHNVGRGLSPDTAAREARLAFGSVDAAKEAHRDGRGTRWIEDSLADIRYALRQMRRAPVFTLVVVLVLAVGVGVNSAIIAFIDGSLKPRPVGIPDHGRLVDIQLVDAAASFREIAAFRQHVPLDDIGAFLQRFVLGGSGDTQEDLNVGFASGAYFGIVQPRMAAGRPLPALRDETGEAPRSAIVSARYARNHFGSESAAIGEGVRLNGKALAIVGVLADGFVPYVRAREIDVWTPLGLLPLIYGSESAGWNARSRRTRFEITGRLRPGVTAAQANAAAQVATPPICAKKEPSRCRRTSIQPFFSASPEQAKGVLIFGLPMMVVTGIVLAIACANVSILLLGRGVTRRREIAVRLSLGASRRRITRQLATEGAVLCVAAGVLGLVVLFASSDFLARRFPDLGASLEPSWRTIVLSVALAAGTGVLFSLMPALHATGAGVAEALKSGAIGVSGRSRLQRRFVIAEVAMSAALLCASALFVDAMRRYVAARPAGYEVSPNLIVAQMPLRLAGYDPDRARVVAADVRARLAALPGVSLVTVTSLAPDASQSGTTTASVTDASAESATDRKGTVSMHFIDPASFTALGTALSDGRVPTPSRAVPEVVISRDLADRLWPRQVAAGRTIRFVASREATSSGSSEQLVPGPLVGMLAQVTGIVDDRPPGSSVGRHFVYALTSDRWPMTMGMWLFVRTTTPSEQLTRAIVSAIRSVDPAVPVSRPRSTLDIARATPRDAEAAGFAGTLAGGFTLALASVGIFAVVAFGVAQRRREIGIRVALGATRSRVVAQFFGDGVRLALIGLAIGIPVGIAFMHLIRASVFGVDAIRPGVVALIAMILFAVAALASWLPALGAASVRPVETLRSE